MGITLPPMDDRVLWILILAFVVAFLLAFSVGANDVSNSFGTSIGSGVLTVTQACILATIFEVAGSCLLGYVVCDFFRKNMYNVELYDGAQQELMIGALACLIGSAMWNIIATALKMPISGTHSVIGATLGFNFVLRGADSIKWRSLIVVVGSWFVSPLLSGFISSSIYLLISKLIISNEDPLKSGLKSLPIFYGVTVFINVGSVVAKGPKNLGLDGVPWYGLVAIPIFVSMVTIIYVATRLNPKVRDNILEELRTGKMRGRQGRKHEMAAYELRKAALNEKSINKQVKEDIKTSRGPEKNTGEPSETSQKPQSETNVVVANVDDTQDDLEKEKTPVPQKPMQSINQRPSTSSSIDLEATTDSRGFKFIAGERLEVFRLFSSLQIMTACFASFAHGTNDVSNAVAPLIPIWNIYEYGYENLEVATQLWLLLFGGIGICAGLWAWGRSVMETVGTGLTQLTPSKGFAVELGAAISAVLASTVGLPISTTHCKIGSLVILGMVSAKYCGEDKLRGIPLASRRNSLIARLRKDDSGTVDMKMFGNIAITWIITVPLAAIATMITTKILISIVRLE